MTTASRTRRIDALMEQALHALSERRWFGAERLAAEALAAARATGDFERMERILPPLLEARRQRMQLAIDAARSRTGHPVAVQRDPITDRTSIEPGCWFVGAPNLVGADARRLRLLALEREIPVLVVCFEPLTQLRQLPIVAIAPGFTIRTKVDPPPSFDAPDLEWFLATQEALGDAALESMDPGITPPRQVEQILLRLDAVPEHEELHAAAIEIAAEARRFAQEEQAERERRALRRAGSGIRGVPECIETEDDDDNNDRPVDDADEA